MFIGHYGAAFLAKRMAPKLSLPACFVACQLVDFAWAALVILGVEKVRLVPGFTASNPLDLYFMPYTHGLLAAGLWSVAAAVACFIASHTPPRWRCALVLGAAVGSHWLLDLVVHVPDLPLVFDGPGDGVAYGPKYGLGLWNQPALAALLELGLLWAAVVANLGRLQQAGEAIARLRYTVLAAVMTLLHLSTLVLPLPTVDALVALQLLVSFSLLAWAAHWADQPTRTAAAPERAAPA